MWRCLTLLTCAFGMVMALLMPPQARACGTDTDCVIGERTYRIAVPPDHSADQSADPIGALIFAHGYRGSAKGTIRNKGLRDWAFSKGLAFVAPKSADEDWMIPGRPRHRDNDGAVEFDYFDALIQDLADKHNIDPDRLIMSGFSAGGMMVWTLACHRGNRFRAFIPVAGTYWEPVPTTCPTAPADLIHIHGLSDKIVPVEGRPIADTKQGNVLLALARAIEQGQFTTAIPKTQIQGLNCAGSLNAKGQVVTFCTHPGGHSIKADYLGAAWQILEGAGRL